MAPANNRCPDLSCRRPFVAMCASHAGSSVLWHMNASKASFVAAEWSGPSRVRTGYTLRWVGDAASGNVILHPLTDTRDTLNSAAAPPLSFPRGAIASSFPVRRFSATQRIGKDSHCDAAPK